MHWTSRKVGVHAAAWGRFASLLKTFNLNGSSPNFRIDSRHLGDSDQQSPVPANSLDAAGEFADQGYHQAVAARAR